MSDAMVERRPNTRFFCHRCNIEFEDVLQDYTCPYCAGGFIEQLEIETDGQTHSGDDFSDADMSNIDDMSNLDDSDEIHQMSHGVPPMLNDLAFLMSGGRSRGAGRRETLMEQLVWMIGGARAGAGAVTAGAPFVLVGAPGDYVFGGEGLDAVVTQLLGQLENAGPPPLPRDALAALPRDRVSEEAAAANTSCSICWDNLQLGETVSRLECEHVFHSACITPWLQLHATCPICRRSLLPDEPPPATAPANTTTTTTTTPQPPVRIPEMTDPNAPEPPPRPATTLTTGTADSVNPATPATPASRVTPESYAQARNTSTTSLPPRLLLRRTPRRRVFGPAMQTWNSRSDTSETGSSSGSATSGLSVTLGGVWVPHPRSDTTATTSNSSTSLNSSDREQQYNMDIDFD